MKDRIFESKDKDGNIVHLTFKRPTQSNLMQGDFIYRKHFSEAVRAGVMTNAEAIKVLKDRDIWNDKLDLKEKELRSSISSIEKEFRDKTISDEIGISKRLELKQLRAELDNLTSIYTDVTNNTAESIGSELRLQCMASMCVVDKNGKKIFKDLEDFRNRFDEQITLDSYRQAIIVNYEVALKEELPDILNADYPEDAWMNLYIARDEKNKLEMDVAQEDSNKKKTRQKKTISV